MDKIKDEQVFSLKKKKKKAGGGLLGMEGDSGQTGGELVGKEVGL